MRNAGYSVAGEELDTAGATAEMRCECGGHLGGGGKPERAISQLRCRGGEMGDELTRERMHNKARITRRELAHRLRIFFLVAAHITHFRQTTRDGVRSGRNALAERQVREDGHEGDGVSAVDEKPVETGKLGLEDESRALADATMGYVSVCH